MFVYSRSQFTAHGESLRSFRAETTPSASTWRDLGSRSPGNLEATLIRFENGEPVYSAQRASIFLDDRPRLGRADDEPLPEDWWEARRRSLDGDKSPATEWTLLLCPSPFRAGPPVRASFKSRRIQRHVAQTDLEALRALERDPLAQRRVFEALERDPYACEDQPSQLLKLPVARPPDPGCGPQTNWELSETIGSLLADLELLIPRQFTDGWPGLVPSLVHRLDDCLAALDDHPRSLELEAALRALDTEPSPVASLLVTRARDWVRAANLWALSGPADSFTDDALHRPPSVLDQARTVLAACIQAWLPDTALPDVFDPPQSFADTVLFHTQREGARPTAATDLPALPSTPPEDEAAWQALRNEIARGIGWVRAHGKTTRKFSESLRTVCRWEEAPRVWQRMLQDVVSRLPHWD